MDKRILIFSLFFSLFIISISYAEASCCVIKNPKCTYWDMGDWNLSQEFCSKAESVLNITTNYYDKSCTELSSNMTECFNGFNYISCGDKKCESPESCSSCSTDCGNCQADALESGSGGGEGSCTPEWGCSEWSNCIDGEQTRTCTNSRPYCRLDKPLEEQECSKKTAEENKSISETEQSAGISEKTGLKSITGRVIENIKANKGISITIISIIALAGILFFSNKLIDKKVFKKKKK